MVDEPEPFATTYGVSRADRAARMDSCWPVGAGVTNSSPRTSSYLLPSSGRLCNSSSVQRLVSIATCMTRPSSAKIWPRACAEDASSRPKHRHRANAGRIMIARERRPSIRSAKAPSQAAFFVPFSAHCLRPRSLYLDPAPALRAGLSPQPTSSHPNKFHCINDHANNSATTVAALKRRRAACVPAPSQPLAGTRRSPRRVRRSFR